MGNINGNLISQSRIMKQVGNSHVDIEPNVYGGAAMQISNASVSYDDEEEELTFYYGCNASLTLKTDNIEHIGSVTNVDNTGHVEEYYRILLHDDGLAFTVTKTPEIK